MENVRRGAPRTRQTRATAVFFNGAIDFWNHLGLIWRGFWLAKTASRRSEMAQDGARTHLRRPKTAPRGSQDALWRSNNSYSFQSLEILKIIGNYMELKDFLGGMLRRSLGRV